MRLGQATRKLCKTLIQGFNVETLAWEVLPFKCSYPPDGRFIGRSVSFYDRRELITPSAIEDKHQVIKVGFGGIDGPEEVLMVYATQRNINRSRTYLYSHTVFNIQGYCHLKRLTATRAASGAPASPVVTDIGTFPVALEKGFSGSADLQIAGKYHSRVTGYIPNYSGVILGDEITFGGDSYTVDEIVPELRMTFIQLTKR